MKYSIPYPDKKIFRLEADTDLDRLNINEGGKPFYLIDRVEYENGIFIYYKDLLFPTKGFVFAEAIMLINQAKSILISLLFCLRLPQAVGFIVLFLLTPFKGKIKAINGLLQAYLYSARTTVNPIVLKDEYWIKTSFELKKLVKSFLINLGIKEVYAQQFSDVIACIAEYDDAYRFRLIDLMSETTKEALYSKPINEIKRLAKIYKTREHTSLKKFDVMVGVITVLFLEPRIKNAFKKALLETDFKNFQYDEIDKHNILLKAGYNYLGLTFKERVKLFDEMYKGKRPTQYILNTNQDAI